MMQPWCHVNLKRLTPTKCVNNLRFYNCGKLGYIARHYRSKRKVNENIVRSKDNFIYVVKDEAYNNFGTRWIIDSGVTQNMIPHRHLFDTYEPISVRNVFLGDISMVEAVGIGSTLMETCVKDCMQSIKIHDILYMPNLHANLISVRKFISRA